LGGSTKRVEEVDEAIRIIKNGMWLNIYE
jgi:hypothetical protein